jgi:hypothetical protein
MLTDFVYPLEPKSTNFHQKVTIHFASFDGSVLLIFGAPKPDIHMKNGQF